MTIEILDLAGYAKREESRIMVMDTRKMHAWVHYARPGEREEMHCHNEDQTMLILEGECSMTFPDGGASVLRPGMTALIRGGSFYALENTGSAPLIFMGTAAVPMIPTSASPTTPARKRLRPAVCCAMREANDPLIDARCGDAGRQQSERLACAPIS